VEEIMQTLSSRALRTLLKNVAQIAVVQQSTTGGDCFLLWLIDSWFNVWIYYFISLNRLL
jgi:hypothetical protein